MVLSIKSEQIAVSTKSGQIAVSTKSGQIVVSIKSLWCALYLNPCRRQDESHRQRMEGAEKPTKLFYGFPKTSKR